MFALIDAPNRCIAHHAPREMGRRWRAALGRPIDQKTRGRATCASPHSKPPVTALHAAAAPPSAAAAAAVSDERARSPSPCVSEAMAMAMAHSARARARQPPNAIHSLSGHVCQPSQLLIPMKEELARTRGRARAHSEIWRGQKRFASGETLAARLTPLRASRPLTSLFEFVSELAIFAFTIQTATATNGQALLWRASTHTHPSSLAGKEALVFRQGQAVACAGQRPRIPINCIGTT